MRAAIRSRVAGRPWWWGVLGLYLLSRAVSTLLLGAMLVLADVFDWALPTTRDVGFFGFSAMWDGTYYREIAREGYPTDLPLDADGHVLPNPWAFLPVFPFVARAVMTVTGAGFDVVAVLLAGLAGAGAALVLYRLLASRVAASTAFWAVALFCFGPMGFILQVAYAESFALLLTFGALLALQRRRYELVALLAVVAAFTRPGALAIALALGIHLVIRFRGRRVDPVRPREWVAIIAGGAVISVAGLAWPVVADAVTGHENAYLETELAWWTGFVGRQEFAPLTPWFQMAGRYLGIAGIVLVVAVLVAFVLWMRSAPVRALGHEIVAFSGSYALYLVGVFLPQQSLFRMVMPLAPLLGDARLTRTRGRRRAALSIAIALQAGAVVLLWFVGYP
ncbi:MAG: hypothetical protein ABW040_07930 [Microbacteriaceae bacterium]